LASSALKVTGVDFSEGQIQIARSKAAETGQDDCNYVQTDIVQMSHLFQSSHFDGAFVHCGIHHLSTAELTQFVEILAQTPKGFPAILVEPVYLDKANLFGLILRKILGVLFSVLRRSYLSRPALDKRLVQATDNLIKLATEKGWFLSPKEVPFDVKEIRTLFSPYFEIVEIVPVTHFGLAAAQCLATLEDQNRAAQMAARSLPVLTFIDRLLIKTRLLPTITSDYLFCRIVLTRKRER
jgi:hypothetical protein